MMVAGTPLQQGSTHVAAEVHHHSSTEKPNRRWKEKKCVSALSYTVCFSLLGTKLFCVSATISNSLEEITNAIFSRAHSHRSVSCQYDAVIYEAYFDVGSVECWRDLLY